MRHPRWNAPLLLAAPVALAALTIGSAGAAWARKPPPPPPPPAPPADPAIAFVASYQHRGRTVYELRVMDADGTNQTTLLSRTSNIIQDPAWSPDLDGNPGNGYQGTLAVTIQNEPDPGYDLFLLDVAVVGGAPQGSNLRKIVEDDLDPNVWSLAAHAEWSVDLAALTPGYQGRIVFTGSLDGVAGSVNVIEMAWDGFTVQPVNGPNSSSALVANAGVALPYPTWSPDGSRIAFGGITASGSGIHVVNSTTGMVLTVVSTGLGSGHHDFQWSRHDSRVAFAHSNGSIYTIDVDLGSSSLRAVPGVAGEDPTWSPDDVEIAYASAGTIRRADVATGQSALLASESRKSFRMPDWRRF